MIRKTAVLAGLLFIAGHTTATVISVPAQYTTIQAAVLAATDGDTVAVSPGTYYENINFRGRNIVLTSLFYLNNDTSYISSTIINGSQPIHPDTASCIILNSYEDSTALIQGFTLTGGKGTKWLDIHGAGTYREGGGILTEFASPVIRYNYIHDNYVNNTAGVNSTGGGGIRCGDGHPVIINNVICNNQAYGYGGGIVLNYCSADVVNNLVVYNSSGHAFGGGGLWLTGSSTAMVVNIINNTVAFNESVGTGTYGGKGGGLFVFVIQANVHNCIFWGNTQSSGGDFITFFGGNITTEYSDVQTVTAGTGNISVAPLFADSAYFFLSPGSPCTDAGDTAFTWNDQSLSSGVALFPSTGTERNDMGAYGGGKPAVLPVCHSGLTAIAPVEQAALFKLMPVPATDFITVVMPGNPEPGQYAELLDLTGKCLQRTVINTTTTQLNLQHFTAGFYLLRITTPGKPAAVQKIQVMR